jgi:hypothetical protein
MQRVVLWAATLSLASILAAVGAQGRGMGGGAGGFHGGGGNFHGGFSHGFHDRDDFRFRDRDDFRFRDGRFRHRPFRPFVFFGTTVFAPVPIAFYPPLPYPAYIYAPVGGYPSCYRYDTTALFNGVPQAVWGIACLQPDGTWRIMP